MSRATDSTGNNAQAANTAFSHNRYEVLRKLVAEPLISFLYDYALKSARFGRMRADDATMPGTPSAYSDPLMESLLETLLPRIEEASGFQLHPTYSYLRVYKKGDVLKRHQDRPSCEVSLTLNLGYEAEKPWPIWVAADGADRSIELEPGDAMLYRGMDVPHWREAFTGEHAVQVFLHYVNQVGPCQEWKYDKREALGTSPMLASMMERFKTSL